MSCALVRIHACTIFIYMCSVDPSFFFTSIHFEYHIIIVVILCCYKGLSLEPPILRPGLKGICVVPYSIPIRAQFLFICIVSIHLFFFLFYVYLLCVSRYYSIYILLSQGFESRTFHFPSH